MARFSRKQSSRGQSESGPPARPRARLAVRLALPLVVLLALLAIPAVVLASGAGPGVTVTPDSGAVGTHVTLNGSHFKPGDKIVIGYTTGDCNSNVTIITGAGGTVDGSGTFTFPFVWPNTDKGSFYVCAIDQTNGHSYRSGNPFQVLSTDPASITVTGAAAGQPVQVAGKNFLPGGGTVEVLYGPEGSNGCANSVGTANVGEDGSFTFTFNAPFTSSTMTIVVTAVEPQGSCGESPVLAASANAQITAGAAGTPTPAVTATATAPAATATPGGGTNPTFPVWPPSGPWTVVYCLIGLLALLLLLLLLLLLTRRRKKDEPVTIQEQDTVTVAPNAAGGAAGQGGQSAVQRNIYAVDPRTQRRVPIAEEVTTVQEEMLDNPGGQSGQPPRDN